ncbi:MAG TPA: nuclear transport factor 2 family protein [Dehalococcoidia bacterium]|nr:nuclear transport factor 2 family protein [Dehalococcoidia bacterium]
MSNVDVVNGIYSALAQGDIQSVLDALDPKVEWTEAAGFPYAGTYIGPQAVLENVFMKLGADWEPFHVHVDKVVDGGDDVVVLGSYSGTYKATGKSMKASVAHAWTLRDGKVAKFVQYVDSLKVAEALR